MANDRIKVNYGKTINLGNYESVRIDIGMEKDVRMGAYDEEAVTEDLFNYCKEKVEEYEKEVMKGRK